MFGRWGETIHSWFRSAPEPVGDGRPPEMSSDMMTALEIERQALLDIAKGESLDEVAKYCGVSLATVKRRIGKADERLERRLRAR